jgi:hypothetical protein
MGHTARWSLGSPPMDNVTHSLVGWTLGQTGLKRRTCKGLAALILGANAPDIDVFLGWVPWPSLATHRGLAHSFFGGVLVLPPLFVGILAISISATAGARVTDPAEWHEAVWRMRSAISCAVHDNIENHRAEGVLAALEGDIDGKAYSWLHTNFDDCAASISFAGLWVGKLNFDPALVKGEVYRSIVMDGWGIRTKKELLPEFRRLADMPRNPSSNPIGTFGVCVVALDPRNARKAIEGPVADNIETAAYAALGPSLSHCVAPGQSITFSRQVLEDALAEGLFVSAFATPAKGAVREDAK